MQYPATELVLNKEGKVYHLNLAPGDVSEKIILVGDQDRVHLIAEFFDTVEHSSQHREFVCKTGTYNGKRISAISTGIGTDNIDIVINELDAIFNIDLTNRCDKSNFQKLDLVRIGTCGILQPDIAIHSYILSTHALGLDNIAHFYNLEMTASEQAINTAICNQIDLPNNIIPYTVESSKELFQSLSSEETVEGITITSSGFYGPQGRQLRLKTRTTELNEKITDFKFDAKRITNFEMESSALFAIGKGLGHQCATICLGIANRPKKDFSSGYTADMKNLIKYVLDRI
jgi:uridine phosphorylase